MIFNVKWVDTNKKHHIKGYNSQEDARRAKKWLIDNGATEVKISIVFEKKTIETTENS